MNRKDERRNQNTINFNAEYEIDSLTNVSLNYSGYFNPKFFGVYHVPTAIYNSQDMVESRYETINDHSSGTSNNSVSIQADRKLNEKSSITWVNYFTANATHKAQDVFTYLDFAGQPPAENNFLNDNRSEVQLYSTQLDYQWKGKRLDVEAGLKYSFVKTFSQLDFSDNENGQLLYRPDKSSDFN